MNENNEDYKQPLFQDTLGFWRIFYGLEGNIAYFWAVDDLINVYPNIKHLYRIMVGHFQKRIKVGEKDAEDYFEGQFTEIEKYLYDPSNTRYTQQAKFKKLRNHNEANKLMHEVYKQLKRCAIESHLELYYGVPKDVLNIRKRDSNINKVFGRNI